jgi:rhomboid protease GluP
VWARLVLSVRHGARLEQARRPPAASGRAVSGLGARAPLTLALLIAIGLVFAADAATRLLLGRPILIELGASWAAAVLAGQVWRLVTAMFLHAGVLHLLVNGWALYQLGALVEVLFGTARLAAIYFASGLAGSLASVAWDLVSGRQQPSVGASGAIFGLLGALIAFLLRHRDRLRPEARSLLLQLLFWAGINIVFGFTADMIDNAAHLGGLAAGLAIGAMIRPAHVGGGA